MRHWIITITILLISSIDAYSQSCYNDNRNDGIRFKQKGDYAKAIRCFRVAKSCPDKPRKNDLDAQIASCQRAMTPKPKPQPPKEVKEKPKPTRLAVDGEIDDIDLEATHSGGHKVFKVETPSGKYEVDSDLIADLVQEQVKWQLYQAQKKLTYSLAKIRLFQNGHHLERMLIQQVQQQKCRP